MSLFSFLLLPIKSKAVDIRTVFRLTVTGAAGREATFSLVLVLLSEKELCIFEGNSVAWLWNHLLDYRCLPLRREWERIGLEQRNVIISNISWTDKKVVWLATLPQNEKVKESAVHFESKTLLCRSLKAGFI